MAGEASCPRPGGSPGDTVRRMRHAKAVGGLRVLGEWVKCLLLGGSC